MQVTGPTLLIDKMRVQDNINRMAEKAKRHTIKFCPHCKTHRSAAVAQWLAEAGAEGITVSSVEMAQYFAYNGWRDITIAFPANILEIEKINLLAGTISLSLLVESEETVTFLKKHLTAPVSVWIKIDTGYRRTGIDWNDEERCARLAEVIAQSGRLQLAGLLTHSGHAYAATSKDEIRRIFDETVERLKSLQEMLYSRGFLGVQLSIGDTPTCSIVEEMRDVDVLRPGNFVFYDLMQLFLESCTEQDIALAMACPVVAVHEERGELVVYGGAAHFSMAYLDRPAGDPGGARVFGYAVDFENRGWGPLRNTVYLSSLSQEHGIVRADREFLEAVKVGDLVYILPVHACLAVNLMKKYYTLEGEVIRTG